MRRGFTLLELIVVVIIVGILAAIGFAQYTTLVEKGRAGEAKLILGQLRTAQELYYEQYRTYASVANLPVDDVPEAVRATNYFTYTCGASGTCTALRCTAAPCKTNGPSAYTLGLTPDGTVSGDGAARYW